MNIGWVSEALPYLPSAGGFRLYGANLIRCLSARHRIHLVSLLREDDSAHLDWARQYCASVTAVPSARANVFSRMANVGWAFARGQWLSDRKQLRAALAQSRSAGDWDIMHVEGEAAGGLVDLQSGLTKVLSIHDSQTLRCAEMLKCVQSRREWIYYRWLQFQESRVARLLYPSYDAVTVVAEPDLRAVQAAVPDADVRLISNGVDTAYFRPLDIPKQEAALVFHGHLAYPPNVDAALAFATGVFPGVREQVSQATLRLVGANPAPKVLELARRPGIEVLGNLPDLRPALGGAQIYVCPIRFGTGIKNKILEAMAMGLPIVAYSGAQAGLNWIAGEHFLQAGDEKEFAGAILKLLREPSGAGRMAAQARHFVEEHFSWEARARAYEELYAELTLRHT